MYPQPVQHINPQLEAGQIPQLAHQTDPAPEHLASFPMRTTLQGELASADPYASTQAMSFPAFLGVTTNMGAHPTPVRSLEPRPSNIAPPLNGSSMPLPGIGSQSLANPRTSMETESLQLSMASSVGTLLLTPSRYERHQSDMRSHTLSAPQQLNVPGPSVSSSVPAIGMPSQFSPLSGSTVNVQNSQSMMTRAMDTFPSTSRYQHPRQLGPILDASGTPPEMNATSRSAAPSAMVPASNLTLSNLGSAVNFETAKVMEDAKETIPPKTSQDNRHRQRGMISNASSVPLPPSQPLLPLKSNTGARLNPQSRPVTLNPPTAPKSIPHRIAPTMSAMSNSRDIASVFPANPKTVARDIIHALGREDLLQRLDGVPNLRRRERPPLSEGRKNIKIPPDTKNNRLSADNRLAPTSGASVSLVEPHMPGSVANELSRSHSPLSNTSALPSKPRSEPHYSPPSRSTVAPADVSSVALVQPSGIMMSPSARSRHSPSAPNSSIRSTDLIDLSQPLSELTPVTPLPLSLPLASFNSAVSAHPPPDKSFDSQTPRITLQAPAEPGSAFKRKRGEAFERDFVDGDVGGVSVVNGAVRPTSAGKVSQSRTALSSNGGDMTPTRSGAALPSSPLVSSTSGSLPSENLGHAPSSLTSSTPLQLPTPGVNHVALPLTPSSPRSEAAAESPRKRKRHRGDSSATYVPGSILNTSRSRLGSISPRSSNSQGPKHQPLFLSSDEAEPDDPPISISPTPTTVHRPRIPSHKEASTHESKRLSEDHAPIPSESTDTSAKRDVRDSSSLSLIQSLSPPIEAIRPPKLNEVDATLKPKPHPQLSKPRRLQRNRALPPMQNEGSQLRTLSVMEPLVLMPLKDLTLPSSRSTSMTSEHQILESPQRSSQQRSPSPAETLGGAISNTSRPHVPVSSGSTPSRLQPYIELVPRFNVSAVKPRVEVLTVSSDEDEPALETVYRSLRPVVCKWANCGGSILASITYLEKHLKNRHRKDLNDSFHPTCQWAMCNHRYIPFLDSRSLVRHILNDHIPQVSFCPFPDCEQTVTVDQVSHHIKRRHQGDAPPWSTPAPQEPTTSQNLPDIPDIVRTFELNPDLVVTPASSSRRVGKTYRSFPIHVSNTVPTRRSFLRPRIHSPAMPSGSKWNFGEFDVSDDSSGSCCAELDDDDDLFREDEPQGDANPAASADLHMLLDSHETEDDTSAFPRNPLSGTHIASPQSSPPQLSPELPSPAHPVFHESNLLVMDQQMDLYDPYGFGAPGDYGPDDLEALLRQHEVGSLVSSSLEEEQEVRGILD